MSLYDVIKKYSFDKLEVLTQNSSVDEYGDPVYSDTWTSFEGNCEQHEERKTVSNTDEEISYSNTIVTNKVFLENVSYKIRINSGIAKVVKRVEVINDRLGNKVYYLLF